jgi:hypothetical protein
LYSKALTGALQSTGKARRAVMTMLADHPVQKAVTSSAELSETIGPSEASSIFDATAKRYLGISGSEFLARWDAGVYRNSELKSRAMRVAMLIPMVRLTSARKKSC